MNGNHRKGKMLSAAEIRHRFSIPDDVAYLNCAYMSPLLDTVHEAGHAGLLRKRHPWTLTPGDFFEESAEVRALFAQLIGASAGDVAIIPAVSYGIAIAAQALAAGPDDRILILAEQFPSNVYSWRESGAEVIFIERPWTENLLEAIDASVSIVAVPQGHWTDGSSLDLVAVGRRCREVGAALVVDATQSLGAVPFDVREVQPDFLIAAGYKWLLGPYSTAFLYAAPRWHRARPIEHNWINRLDSRDFSGLVRYRDAFQPGARRFDVGQRSSFILIPMLAAALRAILDWGVENIHRTLSETTEQIALNARDAGLEVDPREMRLGNMIGIRFPEGIPSRVPRALSDHRVFVSRRGDAIRVAPHLYTTPQDIVRLFAALVG